MSGAAIRDAEKACAAHACEAAIDLLESACRNGPSSYRLHYMLGVCYGGRCRSHSLTDPDMAIPYLRHALRLLGSHEALARAAIWEALAGTVVYSRQMPAVAALRAAIDYYGEAAQIYETLGTPQDCSRVHFNLGNSICDLSEAAGEDRWLEAVAHYQVALHLRTREQDPERHAAVMENLGTAYRRLSGDGLKKCIRCYRQALRVYVRSKYPDKNAALQNNLGNAFLSLPEKDENRTARHARHALHHFDRALSIQSGDTGSRAYAITQYNRAQAYFRLARVSPAAHLKLALECLEEAGAVFERCGENRYVELIRTQLAGISRA